MTGYQVRQYDSSESLVELRDDWDRLLDLTPQATFFQSLDWLTIYWRHFGDSQQLRVLAIRQANQVIGIVPLTIHWQRSRLGSVRILGYPLDHWGTTFGPLGSQPETTLIATFEWLSKQRRQWDVLDLGWASGFVDTATTAALKHAGLATSRTSECELSSIEWGEGWDRYWSSRSGKLRNNVRRCEKRLAALGRVTSIHHCPTGDEPRWDLYEQCAGVAQGSWQARTNTGNTLSDPAVRDFLRDVHRQATHCSAVGMNILLVDDRAIAFSYDYLFQNRVYGLRTGFDPAFAAGGPGTVLLARSLAEYCQQGKQEFDLGETPSAYKRQWRTGTSTSFRYCHYPRDAWRAQALRWKRKLFAPPVGQPTE